MQTTILWMCVATAAAVFAVIIYSVARFRAPQVQTSMAGAPAAFKRRAMAEVVWAIVPILILVATAVPAVRAVMAPEIPHIASEPSRTQRLSSLQTSEE